MSCLERQKKERGKIILEFPRDIGHVWDCSMFQLHGGAGVYILN
jgi:hypothetical protein